ncbi:hypothetical protein ANN_25997 [Periplaneta americana]|uniref:G-protein coupled receptors family 1 profile domain-containing protein n=1 Tax=Periplaneta americana TaxID=6978 RepID=A0ABQ8S557_PERAM|nr:hypothetical protein ANN_25997 [Periplaneta americana]
MAGLCEGGNEPSGSLKAICNTMSLISEPSFSAYSWASQGGFGNQTVVDKVPPDMLYLVDSHWYQFPPMNPLWHGLLGFVIGVLGVISVIGNGMVMYIFSTTKGLRTPSNLLVVNLAFSDFLMMLAMSPAMVINCYYETWVLGPLMCEIYGMCGSLFGCGSIWTMTMIALDRYNVIVKGLSAKPMTNKGAMLRILGVWAFSIGWTIMPLFGWNRYVPEGNMTACGTDYLTKDWGSRSYILVYSIWVYFLPLSTIIYSYWFIVQVIYGIFSRDLHLLYMDFRQAYDTIIRKEALEAMNWLKIPKKLMRLVKMTWKDTICQVKMGKELME